jgi:hypothetical protein
MFIFKLWFKYYKMKMLCYRIGQRNTACSHGSWSWSRRLPAVAAALQSQPHTTNLSQSGKLTA